MRSKSILASLFIILIASVSLTFANAKKGEEAFGKLMDGNKRFVSGSLSRKDVGDTRRKELTKGQAPFAIVVTCSDS
ncbi:MAG TPA: hypothetical protein VF790_12730, partial [Dissulfurispiraceae bacterium]